MPHPWTHRKFERATPQRWLAGCLIAGAGLALTGCTTQYRPVVAAINPVGPAGQPQKYAFAVSNPNEGNTPGTLSGLLTVVDVSGDTIASTPALIPNPTYFAETPDGVTGFVVNAANSLDAIPIGSPSALITSNVVQTTLPPGGLVPSLSAFTFDGAPRLFAPELQLNQVAIFGNTSSPALQQQITVGNNPVYVVGGTSTPRAYVISNNGGTGTGQVAAIEATSLSISNTFAVGTNPVYGVETADNRRAFILNNGSGTVSVINVTNNAIDNANPVINLNVNGITGLQPVWADLATNTNQLIVVSQRPGNATGYLSIINIPLCNAAAQPTNTSCDPNNPTDGQGFGQVLGTVPVGINPVQVAALVDGSQAFVANQGVPGATGIPGSVTVVNLVSATVTNTIPGATAYNADNSVNYTGTPSCSVVASATSATNACVYGHPGTIAATTGTPTGKVYITSPDTNYMTVIETDTDTVDTHVDLQGAGVRVVVSAR